MISKAAITVVIPHLNEPAQLRRCLASLAAQRRPDIPFEIVVVDNGSTQPPRAVCSEFADVRLEIEPIPGPGPARNRGAEVARADLLAFIDADCVAAPGWVEAIVRFMESHPDIDFVGGDIRILPADPNRLTAIEAFESIYAYRARLYVEHHGFSATGNMAVRTAVFRAVGPFGGIATMEDTEWGKRATSQGRRIAYVDEARVYTDPCASFTELTRRWDRHVAHEFRNVGKHPAAVLAWIAKSAAIAASPIVETFAVAGSDRLSGPRARLLAFACLARVRFYRAKRMFGLLMKDNTAAMVGSWNREKS